MVKVEYVFMLTPFYAYLCYREIHENYLLYCIKYMLEHVEMVPTQVM